MLIVVLYICIIVYFVIVSIYGWYIQLHIAGWKQQDTLSQKLTLEKLLLIEYKDDVGVKNKICIIKEIASKWEQIGIFLGFDDSELRNITRNYGTVEERCQELMRRWLQGVVDTRSPTWETLVEAIRKAQYGQLAHQLRQVLFHHH